MHRQRFLTHDCRASGVQPSSLALDIGLELHKQAFLLGVQMEHKKAGYGLVLALQVTVPCTRLTCVQSLSAEFPDHPRQMFCLEISDIQTALAVEDGEQDVRWVQDCRCACVAYMVQTTWPTSLRLSPHAVMTAARVKRDLTGIKYRCTDLNVRA